MGKLKQKKASKKKVVAASKRKAAEAPKVWRIFRFAKRYELRDDERKCRRSGLMFTRDFVSPAAGDEAAGYYQQLGMLDNGDGENFCLLFGLYRRLVNEAGKRSRAFRGYLIDADEQALSDAAIGRLLKINPKRISKLLHKLEQVKLLEHVTMPDKFDKSLNEVPTHSGGKGQKMSAGSGGGRKRAEHSGGGRKRAEHSGGGRKRAEISAQGRSPLNKTTTASKTTNEQIDNGKSSKEEIIKRRSGESNSNALKGQTTKGRTSTTPATTPPSLSRESAVTGGQIVKLPCVPPLAAQKDNRGQPQRLGDVIGVMRHRYSEGSKSFGGEIYQALGLNLTFSPLTVRGRRELGAFGSIWERAEKAGLPPAVLVELRRRAILEAQKIRKRRSRCGNVSAVWSYVFSRLLAAACAGKTELGVCG